MSNKIKRKQSGINREEWITYNWISVQEMQDDEPLFIQGPFRAITKSIEAGEQWDEWRKAYEELHPELKQKKPELGIDYRLGQS